MKEVLNLVSVPEHESYGYSSGGLRRNTSLCIPYLHTPFKIKGKSLFKFCPSVRKRGEVERPFKIYFFFFEGSSEDLM